MFLRLWHPATRLRRRANIFPDPWPKRRHHHRRLIQPPFIERLLQKLKTNATLHIATDSEEYAQHILATVAQYPLLMNVASNGLSLTRSPYRPIISKFEARSQQAGHVVRDTICEAVSKVAEEKGCLLS